MRVELENFKLPALKWSLLAVLVGAGAGLSAWMVSLQLKKAHESALETILKNTTSLLAASILHELESEIGILMQLGKGQTQFQNLPPHILDYSVWSQMQTSSVLDAQPDLERVSVAVNSKLSPDGPLKANTELASPVPPASEADKNWIRPVFKNNLVAALAPALVANPEGAPLPSLLLAIPQEISGQIEALAIHISLEHIQKLLTPVAPFRYTLVDDFGNIIATSEPKSFSGAGDRTFKQNPLFIKMRESKAATGQLFAQDSLGNASRGEYVRLNVGQLNVLGEIIDTPAEPAEAHSFLIEFFVLTAIGIGLIAIFTQIFLNSLLFLPKNSNEFPAKIPVTILHGSLQEVSVIIRRDEASVATELLNHFYTLANDTIKKYGGTFRREENLAFIGIWGVPASDQTEVWRAMRCALDLRNSFSIWNQERVKASLPTLNFTMGVHTGFVLAARVGPVEERRLTFTGEAIEGAKSMDQLAFEKRTDLFVSKDAWTQSEGKFTGQSQIPEKISPDLSEHTSFFSIDGYKNELGESVPVPPELVVPPSSHDPIRPILEENLDRRWMVNNGSQLLGPLTPTEIAQRLFTQELDFDSECSFEGSELSTTIKKSGMYSGSNDPLAQIWVYDGKTIHGPVTLGFINMAMGHKAIAQESYICQKTTTNGWTPLSDFEHVGPQVKAKKNQASATPIETESDTKDQSDATLAEDETLKPALKKTGS